MPLIAEPIALAQADTAGPVQRLDPLEFPHWDELVTSHPAHTVFHTAGWARVLRDTYGYNPVYFVRVDQENSRCEPARVEPLEKVLTHPMEESGRRPAEGQPMERLHRLPTGHNIRQIMPLLAHPADSLPSARGGEEGRGEKAPFHAGLGSTRLVALLPVFEVRSWPQGVRGISLPFTDSCPPLGRDSTDLGTLRTAAEDYGAQRGWRYLELRGGWESVSLASRRTLAGRQSPTAPHSTADLPETPASASFFTHSLDLRSGPTQLWSAFEGSIRRAVRKAQNSGVRVEWSSTVEGMQTYYRLHCRTRRGHGLPPQPFRFFQKMHEHLIGKGWGQIAIAWHAGAPVAAAVFLHSGKRVIYKFGASDASSQQVRGNNLVMWNAIERYSKLGFETLDFGRTDFEHEGLRRFKLGWGATETILYYHRYDLRRGDYVACPNRTTGWHNHVFRQLPIPLSRLIGGVLYRYLP